VTTVAILVDASCAAATAAAAFGCTTVPTTINGVFAAIVDEATFTVGATIAVAGAPATLTTPAFALARTSALKSQAAAATATAWITDAIIAVTALAVPVAEARPASTFVRTVDDVVASFASAVIVDTAALTSAVVEAMSAATLTPATPALISSVIEAVRASAETSAKDGLRSILAVAPKASALPLARPPATPAFIVAGHDGADAVTTFALAAMFADTTRAVALTATGPAGGLIAAAAALPSAVNDVTFTDAATLPEGCCGVAVTAAAGTTGATVAVTPLAAPVAVTAPGKTS